MNRVARKNKTIITVAIAVWLCALPALISFAQTSQPASSLQEIVNQLIVDLDSPNRQLRSSAQQQLRKLGPKILPLLPTTQSVDSPAVRDDIQRLRRYLEDQKSRQSILPRMVGLPQEITIGDAMKQLSSQTGNRMATDGIAGIALNASLRFDEGEMTFWEAVQAIENASSLKATGIADGRLLWMNTAEKNGTEKFSTFNYRTQSGPFRILIPRAQLRPLVGNATQQLLRCSIQLLAEPRLAPLFVKYKTNDFTANVANRRHAPYSPGAKHEKPWNSEFGGVEFFMDFVVPRSTPLELFDLHGQVQVHMATEVERIEIEKALAGEGKSKRVAGIQVTVDKSRELIADEPNEDKDSYHMWMRMRVSYDEGGPEFESHRTWMFYNNVYLEDERGQRIPRQPGFKTAQQNDGSIVVEYEFRNLTRPKNEYSLVYEAPTLLLTVPLELDLKNIPVSNTTSTATE